MTGSRRPGPPPWRECRKYLVAAVGALAEITAAGVLHGTAQLVAVGVVAVATAAGVYGTTNDLPAEIGQIVTDYRRTTTGKA